MKLHTISSLLIVLVGYALALPSGTTQPSERTLTATLSEHTSSTTTITYTPISGATEDTLTVTWADPTPTTSISNPANISTPADNITAPYYLKTKALDGPSDAHDGLYVLSYHTGAGLSDATLGDKTYARPAYLNNTYQMVNLTSDYPWSFFLYSDTNYAGWEPVTIEPGFHTSGLFLNETGLQWDYYDEFGGWLVCDWYHGVPQLFYRVDYYNYTISTCSRVDLIPEYISDELPGDYSSDD